MALLLATVATTGTQSAHAHGHHGYHGGHASAMSATGIPTALATHSTAFLYGFGLGKSAGLRGYYDVMNECSNRPYLSTNVTGAIKNFTSLQQVNDCDSGYDQGWNNYCHIGLAKHADAAAICPGTSGSKTELNLLNTSSTLP
ncbi:MAG: hypothetical protein WA364_07025 [Candidatus Nitrosopolaris sp.]